MARLLTDDSEVVFEQSGETKEAMKQEGLLSSRRKEKTELEDTQPHDGTRRKAMEFGRPGEEELEAAGSGVKDNVNFHSDEMSDLRPEQQIQNEEETRTPPPRREPHRMESQQPRGPRDGINGVGSVPGYVAAQRMYPADRNRPYSEWSPVEKLEGTVSRMQRDMENLQTENRFLRTRRTGPVPLVRQAALTTTKVPWFSGSTSWEQYQQVFDAIALSNGWGDATAALQLLSHLQGGALSVALLMPMPRRASRKELTDALSSHYGSPGRLATYRRQFDKQHGNRVKTRRISV